MILDEVAFHTAINGYYKFKLFLPCTVISQHHLKIRHLGQAIVHKH